MPLKSAAPPQADAHANLLYAQKKRAGKSARATLLQMCAASANPTIAIAEQYSALARRRHGLLRLADQNLFEHEFRPALIRATCIDGR
ncbi:MAG TPA: hypothetical protein VHM88_24155, partial [Candidatus Acidoferrales bacterium]|nr:hypothetical protein [Candidatus Acidoferrales bacterium]